MCHICDDAVQLSELRRASEVVSLCCFGSITKSQLVNDQLSGISSSFVMLASFVSMADVYALPVSTLACSHPLMVRLSSDSLCLRLVSGSRWNGARVAADKTNQSRRKEVQ